MKGLNYTGSPTGDLIISIETDDENKPSGTIIASSTIAKTTWDGWNEDSLHVITLNNIASTTPGTTYWWRLKSSVNEPLNSYYHTRYANFDVYANGKQGSATNAAGTTFNFAETYDRAFQTYYSDYCQDGYCNITTENCSTCEEDCGECVGGTNCVNTDINYYFKLPNGDDYWIGTSTDCIASTSPTSTIFYWPTSTNFMDNSMTEHFTLYYLLAKIGLGFLIIWLFIPKKKKHV